MDSLHQSRNLSVNQTLDEILGISSSLFKSDTSSSSNGNGVEKNSVNSTMRPPTRHGRESAGSNEENKDPISIENGNITTSQPSSSSLFLESPSGANRRHSEDEFFKKLNDIRRRSLISTVDMPTSSTTTSISIHPESPKRESVRPRLEIHVEEAEPVGVPVERETSGNSEEVNEEPQSLTFRVDDKSDKDTDKKEVTDKKVPKLKFAGNDKLPPKRPKSTTRPPKEQVDTAMMQRSMFNSANSKPSSDAHHKEWLAKKEKEIRERKQKEKEELERKKEMEKERKENSAKLYQRWVQDHDEKMKKFKEIRDLKTKEKKEKVKTEKEEKRREAEKNFQMWKQERSRSVTDLRRKLEEEAEKKRKDEELERQEKQKEAQAAFLAWKRKKEEFLSEDARKQRREEREKREKEEQYTKDFKLMCATEAYETWMEMKDKEREMLADLVLIEAPPIPWIPPSNLVPRQFVRSSQGNRPKRSQSAKSIAKRSRSRPSTTTSLRPFR